MQTAFITGISGQDGSYLSEHLLEQGYRVTGIVRRHSVAENQDSRIHPLVEAGKIETEYGDVMDPVSIQRALGKFRPDLVFNLASQSHVGISFKLAHYTSQVNGVGAMNVFDAVQDVVPKARLYQASSSEMFGQSVDGDNYQRLATPMKPVSPYGVAKLMAYNTIHRMRESGMYAVNGVLFNHESPRRGTNFVTAKVIQGAVRISLGKQNKLALGNLDSQRDWGASQDYVRAMLLMLQQDEPDDYLVATGQTRSVRDLCAAVFGRLNLNYREHVVQDERFMRPREIDMLRGDFSMTGRKLGWSPQVSFDHLIDDMVEHWKGIENG